MSNTIQPYINSQILQVLYSNTSLSEVSQVKWVKWIKLVYNFYLLIESY